MSKDCERHCLSIRNFRGACDENDQLNNQQAVPEATTQAYIRLKDSIIDDCPGPRIKLSLIGWECSYPYSSEIFEELGKYSWLVYTRNR